MVDCSRFHYLAANSSYRLIYLATQLLCCCLRELRLDCEVPSKSFGPAESVSGFRTLESFPGYALGLSLTARQVPFNQLVQEAFLPSRMKEASRFLEFAFYLLLFLSEIFRHKTPANVLPTVRT